MLQRGGKRLCGAEKKELINSLLRRDTEEANTVTTAVFAMRRQPGTFAISER